MHIPDDFLSNGTAGSLMATAVAAVGFALHKVRSVFLEKIPVLKTRLATFPDFGGGNETSFQNSLTKYGKEKIWRMATIGALIFSAQMINFPIGGGTSGHLLGGVLAALILGPFEALLVLTAILAIQAFIFGDGGVLALGANIFNMGIVGTLGGYGYFKFLVKGTGDIKKVLLKNAFVAAWLSVVFAAMAASFEISFSGTKELATVLPAMILTHLAIGFMEAVITVTVLSILMKNNFNLEIVDKEKTDEKQ